MFAQFTNNATGKRINVNPSEVRMFEAVMLTTEDDMGCKIWITGGLDYVVRETERSVRARLTKALNQRLAGGEGDSE